MHECFLVSPLAAQNTEMLEMRDAGFFASFFQLIPARLLMPLLVYAHSSPPNCREHKVAPAVELKYYYIYN